MKLLGIASAIRDIPQKSIAVFDSNAGLHPEAKIIVGSQLPDGSSLIFSHFSFLFSHFLLPPPTPSPAQLREAASGAAVAFFSQQP
jgi:hypothetical protein